MSVEAFKGLVLVAVVDDGAIVAGEYQDGVVRQLEAVEGVHESIMPSRSRLIHEFAAFPAKRGCGTRGTCTSCVPIYKKKGSSLWETMKLFALLVMMSAMSSSFQRAGLPPGHPADAGDAADYRIVMSLTRF